MLISACGVKSGGFRAKGLPPQANDGAAVFLSQRIDDFVESLAPQTFNGALVVEREGNLILGKGYGYADKELQLPYTTSTLSSTASMAQQITAVAILKLHEKKSLNLHDPLSKFLPALPIDKGNISIQQLLQHTAGLPEELSTEVVPVKKEPFLEVAKREQLRFSPGTDYLYSPLAYRILAAVVEEVTGLPYETYISQEILLPCKMESTGYRIPVTEGLATARETNNGNSAKELLAGYRASRGDLWHIMGSGGLLSTIEDMYRWNWMLFRGDLLTADSRQLLFSLMDTPFKALEVAGYALDEISFGSPMLVHTSRAGEFVAQLIYFPGEKLSVLILANQFNGQVEQLGVQIARMMLNPNFVPSPLPYEEQKFVRVPQANEALYARSLLAFLQNGSKLTPEHIIDSVYNNDFKENEAIHTHLTALTKLKERLGTARLEKAQQVWPQYMFTFYEPEASIWYLLRLKVELQEPHRINGIGLEAIDALNARW